MSKAGSLPGVGAVGLAGQDVSGGRNFGVVSGEAIINQNLNQTSNQGMPPGMMPEIMNQVNQNIAGMPSQPITQSNVTPFTGPMQDQNFQQIPGNNITQINQNQPVNQAGGLSISNNPSLSPTDAMVNRIAEAERAVKNERRSQWLQMNQESAANVLSSIGTELPAHLKGGNNDASAAEFLANAIGSGKDGKGDEALYRRMSEVAVRRVARKRGVAVETPQIKLENGILSVNVTYVDDGRVLDTPDNLSSAFEHAISTEVALKGLSAVVEVNLFRSKDGTIDKIGDDGNDELKTDSGEEMFACEICDGLVKDSDKSCPHCGAIFEDEDFIDLPSQRGPSGPSSGGPPKRGGPPGPSRGSPPGPRGGGPPKRGGPPGPSRGSPPGPRGGGPPKRGGPPGPSRGSPPGPRGGGPPKRGGPPTGGPKGGPSGGGPPKRSGAPGARKGGPPKRSGPSGGGPPKKTGPPSAEPQNTGGAPKGGPPKRRGPPSGPKRGPPK